METPGDNCKHAVPVQLTTHRLQHVPGHSGLRPAVQSSFFSCIASRPVQWTNLFRHSLGGMVWCIDYFLTCMIAGGVGLLREDRDRGGSDKRQHVRSHVCPSS